MMRYQELPIRSDSMWPWLRAGDRAIIEWFDEPADPIVYNESGGLESGTIVVALPKKEKTLLAHRLIDMNGQFVCKGDCNTHFDAIPAAYVGRVIGRKRFGRIWYWQVGEDSHLFRYLAKVSANYLSKKGRFLGRLLRAWGFLVNAAVYQYLRICSMVRKN